MDEKLKRCSRCGKLKPITEFYTKGCWCKKCYIKYSIEYWKEHKEHILVQKKKYRQSHREQIRKYDKEYYITYKEKRKRYYLNNKEKLLKRMSDWRKSPRGRLIIERYEQTPKRKRFQKVQKETRMAVARGDIVKPKLCELCEKERRLDSHHEDYSKPLQVVWLCGGCHGKRHSASNDDIKKKIRMIYEKKYNVANKEVIIIPERMSNEIMSGLSNSVNIR